MEASLQYIHGLYRKGAKPGLIWEELCLHHADGSPTEAYKTIYHI